MDGRFDGFPYVNWGREQEDKPEIDFMEEGHRLIEDRLCGQMANDWDPHDPTKDKEETR